jgi:hypothetical protein
MENFYYKPYNKKSKTPSSNKEGVRRKILGTFDVIRLDKGNLMNCLCQRL